MAVLDGSLVFVRPTNSVDIQFHLRISSSYLGQLLPVGGISILEKLGRGE